MIPFSPTTVARVVPCEHIQSLSLTPEQAFVLSRVNGVATVKDIAQTLGVDVAFVIASLESLADHGLVQGDSETPAEADSSDAPERPPSEGDPRIPDEATCRQIEVALDSEAALFSSGPQPQWTRELCRSIRYVQEQCRERDPRARLGLALQADFKQIQRRFIALMKRFHPDRYFSYPPSAYHTYLQDIAQCLTQAFESLDPRSQRLSSQSTREKRVTKGPTRGQDVEKLIDLAKVNEEAGKMKMALGFYQMASKLAPNDTEIQAAVRRLASRMRAKE